MAAPLSFSDVTVAYGSVRALDAVTASFGEGLNVVLGPNGAGKTTLFRVGAGVLPPDTGGVSIDGVDPFERPGIKRRVGYLPHGTPLNARLSVAENLEFWGRVHGFEPSDRAERVDRVIETMRLGELADRAGTDLSRGQKQRVMIARCLLSDPSVLFLDEPTSGLDPTAAAALRDRLAALADDGRTLCYSTHNLYEAQRMADELTVVRDGQVVAQGPEAELSDRLRGGVPTVRVRADATAKDFDALGVDATFDGESWRVALPAERTVPDLVRGLVDRDVAISGVWPDETSLEELYRELAGGSEDD